MSWAHLMSADGVIDRRREKRQRKPGKISVLLGGSGLKVLSFLLRNLSKCWCFIGGRTDWPKTWTHWTGSSHKERRKVWMVKIAYMTATFDWVSAHVTVNPQRVSVHEWVIFRRSLDSVNAEKWTARWEIRTLSKGRYCSSKTAKLAKQKKKERKMRKERTI